MDSAVYASYRSSYHTGSWSQLRLALAVSVFSHLLFVASLVSEAPQRSARVLSAVPISVRLEHLPRVPPAGPAVAAPDEPPLPRRIDRRITVSGGERSAALLPKVSATKPDLAAPLALPQVTDLTVYTARDLDSYPRPVVPLDAARLEDPAAGTSISVRLELTIDEHGIVNDVALTGPGPSGLLEMELRAMLAATRFIPARKDGRAVKSRVLLSINLIAKNVDR